MGPVPSTGAVRRKRAADWTMTRVFRMDPHLSNSVNLVHHLILHNRNSLYIKEFLFNIK